VLINKLIRRIEIFFLYISQPTRVCLLTACYFSVNFSYSRRCLLRVRYHKYVFVFEGFLDWRVSIYLIVYSICFITEINFLKNLKSLQTELMRQDDGKGPPESRFRI